MYGLAAHHTTLLVVNALLHAVMRKGLPRILHSDQGSEYASKAYIRFVESIGIRVSMSRKRSPWENGYQESFYSGFKVDFGDPNRYETLGELVEAIDRSVYYYNQRRIHTALKMSPMQYVHHYYLKSVVEKVS